MSLAVRSSRTGFKSVKVNRRGSGVAQNQLRIALDLEFARSLTFKRVKGNLGKKTTVGGGRTCIIVQVQFNERDQGTWEGTVVYGDACNSALEYEIKLSGVRVSDGNVFAEEIVA